LAGLSCILAAQAFQVALGLLAALGLTNTTFTL
jgi:hypothetical protein